MNKLVMTAIAASIALATPAFADDAHHPEKKQASRGAPAQPAAMPEQAVKQMQYNAKKMLGQINRIASAKTDEERQTAMAEHMQTLQENMQMARGMMQGGPGMMEGGQAGGSPERMQQLEKRMDMMQMMMQQMSRRPNGAAAPAMPMMK